MLQLTLCGIAISTMAMMILSGGAHAQSPAPLDLMAPEGWSGPVTADSDPAFIKGGTHSLRWDYQFHDTAKGEELSLRKPIPADMSQYGGFTLWAHVDSPKDTVFKVRFHEKDGDNWEWVWRPKALTEGWNRFEVTDFLTGGYGPFPWDKGDHKRDYKNLEYVTLLLSDEPDRTKSNGGKLYISEFKFLSEAEAADLGKRRHGEREQKLDRTVDLSIIGQMEDPENWWGPRPEQISLSSDCTTGSGSIQTELDLLPGENFQLQRPFLRGRDPVNKDFTAIRGMKIAYRVPQSTEPVSFDIRLFDRNGGWLGWQVPASTSSDWVQISLAIPTPEECAGRIDLKQIAGFGFYFQAPENRPLTGIFRADDLRLLPTGEGLPPLSRAAYDDYSKPLNPKPMPIQKALQPKPFHVIVMGTGVSYSLQEGKGDQAIQRIDERVAKYHEIPGWQLSFGPEEMKAELPKVREAILQAARHCEAKKIPFYIQVAGPGGFCTPVEIARETLDAAPNSCQGIYMGETPFEDYPDGVKILIQLLEAAHSHGKKLVFHRFTDTWWQIFPKPEVMGAVFAPRYRETLVPMWENLEPSCEGLCAGTVLGLWRSGLASDWGMSVQSWWWENMRLGVTNDMPAHNWMRMFLQGISMGASYVQIEPEWSMFGANERALHRFAELLRTGAIVPASGPEEALSHPKVALQAEATDHFGIAGLIRCAPWIPTDRAEQLTRGDIFRRLYRSTHYYDQISPIAQDGFVAILPPAKMPKDLNVLKTDGYRVHREDRWLTAEMGEPYVHESFAEAAKALPFTTGDCFLSAVRIGEGEYQVVLMDPEERYPVEICARMQVRLLKPVAVLDRLSGEKMTPGPDGLYQIQIPAGGYRILRVKELETGPGQ